MKKSKGKGMGNMSMGNHSGMSKLADPRKACPPPIKGTGFESTMMGSGKSGKGAPTQDPRKSCPPPAKDSGHDPTMTKVSKKK